MVTFWVDNMSNNFRLTYFSCNLLFHFSFPAFSSHPLISPVHWFCRVIPAIVGLPWNLQMYFKKFKEIERVKLWLQRYSSGKVLSINQPGSSWRSVEGILEKNLLASVAVHRSATSWRQDQDSFFKSNKWKSRWTCSSWVVRRQWWWLTSLRLSHLRIKHFAKLKT